MKLARLAQHFVHGFLGHPCGTCDWRAVHCLGLFLIDCWRCWAPPCIASIAGPASSLPRRQSKGMTGGEATACVPGMHPQRGDFTARRTNVTHSPAGKLDRSPRRSPRDSRKGPKTIVPAKGERLIWLEMATCPKSVRDDGGIACTGKIVTARSLMFPGSPGQRPAF